MRTYWSPLFLVAAACCAAEDRGAVRATWVWQTSTATEPAAREDFFVWAAAHRVTEVFLQVQHRTQGTEVTVSDAPAVRAFLRLARGRGILVHALDGSPEAAVSENHAQTLSAVRAVLRFNAGGELTERFHGIHLDNEPYLLLGYDGPGRDRILQDFLELNRQIAFLLRSEGSEMVYGVDVPFWFEQPSLEVSFGGVRKTVTAHLLELVDNLGVMDYRNRATGGDGILAHARRTLDTAAKAGKKVFIGVETLPSLPGPAVFAAAVEQKVWARLDPVQFPLLHASRFEEYPLRAVSGLGYRYIGLAAPEAARGGGFSRALVKLARALAKTPSVECAVFRQNANRVLASDSGYSGFEVFPLEDAGGPGGCGEGYLSSARAIPKITFAGMSESDLERELEQTERALHAILSFYGIAIHDYAGYRALCDHQSTGAAR